MIPELGHYALILGLCFALCLSLAPCSAVLTKRTLWLRYAKLFAYGQFIFVSISFIFLVLCFVNNDFSVAYVANHSNSALPMLFKICATWGAHEGSMLLWAFILSLWIFLVATTSQDLPRMVSALVLSVLSIINFGVLLFIEATSNPFLRILPIIPADGADLNPLLQDIGLAIHPPILYLGYVGFSVAFAFAVVGLLCKRYDKRWAQWVHPWTLAAWSFLTLGIVLGSWWAYRELGWGGWWFWDPVENASFMPWLAGTALLHILCVVRKRDTFKSFAILTAICAFALSLLGTFLVRSGVITSVHAFANDPTRGTYMLAFLFIVISSSLGLYAWRARAIKTIVKFDLFSKETFLLLNNIILLCAMFTVLIGTLYPLALDTLGMAKISVGSPYFNKVFAPFMILMMFLMGLAPQVNWHRAEVSMLKNKMQLLFIVSVGMTLAVALFYKTSWTISFSLWLAFWLIVTTCYDFYQKRLQAAKYMTMLFAHIGVAVCAIGIILTSSYSIERNMRLTVGEQATLGPYQVQFQALNNIVGANYTGYSGRFVLYKDKRVLAHLNAEKRLYTVARTMMTESAIAAGFFSDVYLAMGQQVATNTYAVRAYYKPFVRWIWAGGILMLIGGLLSFVLRLLTLTSKQVFVKHKEAIYESN